MLALPRDEIIVFPPPFFSTSSPSVPYSRHVYLPDLCVAGLLLHFAGTLDFASDFSSLSFFYCDPIRNSQSITPLSSLTFKQFLFGLGREIFPFLSQRRSLFSSGCFPPGGPICAHVCANRFVCIFRKSSCCASRLKQLPLWLPQLFTPGSLSGKFSFQPPLKFGRPSPFFSFWSCICFFGNVTAPPPSLDRPHVYDSFVDNPFSLYTRLLAPFFEPAPLLPSFFLLIRICTNV